jgi:hypothetical protein
MANWEVGCENLNRVIQQNNETRLDVESFTVLLDDPNSVFTPNLPVCQKKFVFPGIREITTGFFFLNKTYWQLNGRMRTLKKKLIPSQYGSSKERKSDPAFVHIMDAKPSSKTSLQSDNHVELVNFCNHLSARPRTAPLTAPLNTIHIFTCHLLFLNSPTNQKMPSFHPLFMMLCPQFIPQEFIPQASAPAVSYKIYFNPAPHTIRLNNDNLS